MKNYFVLNEKIFLVKFLKNNIFYLNNNKYYKIFNTFLFFNGLNNGGNI